MKPLPKPNAETRPFWEGCLNEELRYQHCNSCGRTQFPPGSLCTSCHESALEWRVSAGQGQVHSFTVVNRAPLAEFKADAPYVIALVDMDEGFRLMLNVRGDDKLDTAIGDKVRIFYEATELEDIKLPQAARL